MASLRLPVLVSLVLLASAPALASSSPESAEDAWAHITQDTPLGDASLRRSLQVVGAAPRVTPLGSGFWSTKGSSFVDGAGRPVSFSGVVWSGMETPDRVVQGLWKRSYKNHLDQMRQMGFNTIRILFSGSSLDRRSRPRASTVNYALNPDLKGLNSLQVLDKIIVACKARNMKVILDFRRVNATATSEGGLWWDKFQPPAKFLSNWMMLAKRYKGLDTILGLELFNELHPCAGCPAGAPFWGLPAAPGYDKYNVRTAALRTANAIQAIEPRWIIFISGLYTNYWWGGNVGAVQSAEPITLSVPNKLAYSTREGGPYTYWQPFYNDTTFPQNLGPLFQSMWGYVQEQGIAPVTVASFGTFYKSTNLPKDNIDRIAFQTLVAYMKKTKVSWTVNLWGFDSTTFGGLLGRNWLTPDTRKFAILQSIMKPGFTPGV